MIKPDEDENKCPVCGSTRLAGLMQAFWVPLREDGSTDGEWNDWNSETEVGEERMCYDCDWRSRNDKAE